MLPEPDRMRQHLERLPLAYIELDASYRVLEWNPAAERTFGYRKEEALGRVCLELILTSPIDDQVKSVIRRVEAGDMQAHNVNENRTKDGRIITCEWFNTPLMDSAGKFAGVIAMAQEITARKRAEDANRQLAAIVESSDDAIIGKTLDGMIVNWNRGAERMYGYTPDEVIGRSISVLVPYNRADEVPKILVQIRQGKSIRHLQTVRKTKDGRLLDVSLSISPIRNASGAITGASTIARDVTAQRQAEKRLRESADLFQQLAANIDGYFWVNAPDDSQMYFMSPGYERITGLKCATLYARPDSWSEIVHPDDRARVLAATKALDRAWGSRLEYRITRADGVMRWIRDRAFPVRNAAGEIYRVVGIGEDITDCKHAKEKIALARDFYLSLLDRFPTPIGRTGPDSNCDYFNATWLEFTGRTLEQEVGYGWTEAVHPDDVDQCLKEYLEAFHARRPVELHYRLRRHDGVYRWMLVYGRPFVDLDGQFAGYIGSCFDITDQRVAIDELRESKKRVQTLSHRLLAVREEERGRLARELHDGISQTLTTLALTFEAGMSAPPKMRRAKLHAARAWLEKGLRQAREMANDLRPPMLDHLGPLAAILWLIERFNSKKALQIHFRHDGISGRLAPDVETVVYRLVEEALSNVARHARVSEASVRIWLQDGVLNVQIEDQGVGFDPEAPLASATKVGLAAIREQVELFGGRLVITSGIGEGTSLLAQWPLVS